MLLDDCCCVLYLPKLRNGFSLHATGYRRFPGQRNTVCCRHKGSTCEGVEFLGTSMPFLVHQVSKVLYYTVMSYVWMCTGRRRSVSSRTHPSFASLRAAVRVRYPSFVKFMQYVPLRHNILLQHTPFDCRSRSLFNETHLEKMLRDLHGSLVEFKPYHESTVTNLVSLPCHAHRLHSFHPASAAFGNGNFCATRTSEFKSG